MATCHLHSGLGNPTSFKSTNTQASTRRELPRPRLRANSVRCGEATQVTCETHRVTVKNENDSQDICRVLNGMWQTSDGWGRIDRDNAVEAMLRYADAGLSTFDMADHFVVKNGKDSLHICLVVNGMWQTSGSWDRIDRDNGVDAMLKYADAGVITFDMADICRMDVASLDMLQFHWYEYLFSMQNMANISRWTFHVFIVFNHVNIPFAGPPLNTPSPQKYKRVWSPELDQYVMCIFYLFRSILTPFVMCGRWSMPGEVGAFSKLFFRHSKALLLNMGSRSPTLLSTTKSEVFGLSEHIQDCNAVFSLTLDEEDRSSIKEVTKKGKNLLQVIGDCGDEYRRR
ncbi:hypothetical protein DVH24_039043 [Malus domestica]|uniref:NADP-dependent oxidoreductase domain-containing protein n=1 Tax=Malus domestica TaxID=3750 RepID=A0A498K911_MALDO|nr:hypothetical protein DVH24_039043 [Malus domestica]